MGTWDVQKRWRPSQGWKTPHDFPRGNIIQPKKPSYPIKRLPQKENGSKSADPKSSLYHGMLKRVESTNEDDANKKDSMWKANVFFCFFGNQKMKEILLYYAIIEELWPNRLGKYIQLDASGTRGGIVTLLDRCTFKRDQYQQIVVPPTK